MRFGEVHEIQFCCAGEPGSLFYSRGELEGFHRSITLQILVERASSRREDGERIRRDVKVDTPLLQRVLFDGTSDDFEACVPGLPGLTLYGSDLVDYRRLARLSRRTREGRRFLHGEAVFYHPQEGGGPLRAV